MKKGSVIVKMKDYIVVMVGELPKHMIGSTVTPASNCLFEVRKDRAVKLSAHGCCH